MSSKWQKRKAKIIGWLWVAYSHFAGRHIPIYRRFLKARISALPCDRLHVGCGDVLLKGWLNIRHENREEYGRIKNIAGSACLNYNLLKPWPVEKNSIHFIAGSHFIEHLDLNKGIDFLNKAYAVMATGGIIRLSCPDLELYARAYVQKDNDFFENKWIREWCAFKKAETPGEIFIAKAYDSGGNHKWFYDFDSLKHILQSAGFQDVRRCARLEGGVPDLELIELADRVTETVYVEGVKK